MSESIYTDNPLIKTQENDNKTIGNGAKVDVTDLCYSVVVNGKMKRLLKNVCFNLDPGDLCALMGPSGAGKRYYFIRFQSLILSSIIIINFSFFFN